MTYEDDEAVEKIRAAALAPAADRAPRVMPMPDDLCAHQWQPAGFDEGNGSLHVCLKCGLEQRSPPVQVVTDDLCARLIIDANCLDNERRSGPGARVSADIREAAAALKARREIIDELNARIAAQENERNQAIELAMIRVWLCQANQRAEAAEARVRELERHHDDLLQLHGEWVIKCQAAEARCAEQDAEIERLRTDLKTSGVIFWRDKAEAAEARCAELEQDKARLDWLERGDTSWNDVARQVRLGQGRITTYRAAIDAAIASAESPPPDKQEPSHYP